jgi:FMN phosphatase YigB (HAD superfamily)
MAVYLADESCKSTVEYYYKQPGRKIISQPNLIPDPAKNLELLASKEVLLIDVFNTFIKPAVTIDDDMTLDRLGVVALVKKRLPREGFADFLSHYHNAGKKIGINSDAFEPNEFQQMRQYLSFDNCIDKYFSMMYIKEIMVYPHPSEANYFKDFSKMAKEIGGTSDNTLVIGDSIMDMIPALDAGIDVLLIPTFDDSRDYSFSGLIPQ